jgi:hypothetical protein
MNVKAKSITGSFTIKQTLDVKKLNAKRFKDRKLNFKKLNVMKSLNWRMKRFKKRCMMMRR